jgi:DEAD/DEAH box helicase
MSDVTPTSPDPLAEGLMEAQVAELLRANGLDEVVSRSRQVAVLQEITRHHAAEEEGDEGARSRLAQALERFALTVRQADGRRRLFDEAFVCRRALEMDDMSLPDRLAHLLCLAADALAADRRAELVMLLRNISPETLEIPADVEWSEELLLHVARAFTIMARRSSGWDDVRAAGEEIARLRELQAHRESATLADAGPPQLSSLVALYNLARMVDLIAEYLVSGSPGDVAIRLDRHHANVSEILELEPDPVLEHIADLLHVGLRALADGSVWTVTRGLGARIATFVEALASHERENPVLELWPSQRTALRSSLLDPAKRALVVQMPTSAGKTLVAEFAIVQGLALNPDATVAYVVPTRALVNQITLRLRTDLAPLEMNVEAAVPVFELDPVEDTLLQGERIHVLVTTPEKLDLLLRQDHPSVSDIALLVADEAHNLGDGERGARLELMLGSMKRERPGARFLLLSPFLPNARDLAGWLGDDPEATVSVDWKPTELVTAGAQWTKPRNQPFELELTTLPTAHFVELDREVTVPLGPASPQRTTRSKMGVSVSAALRLAGRGSVLILCRGRGTAEDRAAQIAAEREDRDLTVLGQAVLAYAESELGREHPLPKQLRRGVAYHHAGLSHDLRYLLERMIDTEDVDVVCGTTTLAQGVNFPIATVIVETLQKPRDPTGWQHLTFAEFWNIAGRAGRALRDRLGLVVYPAENAGSLEQFREYIQNDAQALSSVLIEALERVNAADEAFDVSFVRRHRTMAIFTQYLAHALSVGGYENARAEIEDLLRSSLVYHQTLATDPALAQELITLARRYLDSVSAKSAGYLRLADGTGFSLSSVDWLYAQQRSEHREFEDAGFWQPNTLFSPDLEKLTGLISVLGDIPELNLGHRETGPFNPRVVAGVVTDWTAGATVDEIADRWFSTAEEDPDKRRRLAGHYLYSKLVGQVPWGMGAVQRLALTADEDIQAVGHVPSLVFYGVRTREAAALRMAGVPRIAAEGLGRQWGEEGRAAASSFDGMRAWLSGRSPQQWSDALPPQSPLDGDGCRRVWSILAGVSAE